MQPLRKEKTYYSHKKKRDKNICHVTKTEHDYTVFEFFKNTHWSRRIGWSNEESKYEGMLGTVRCRDCGKKKVWKDAYMVYAVRDPETHTQMGLWTRLPDDVSYNKYLPEKKPRQIATFEELKNWDVR